MEYFLKKLISRLFFPVPLVLELLLLGFILQRFSRFKRTGKGFVVAGVVLMVVFGYGFGTSAVLRSIERTYPPFTVEMAADLPAETDVLVLGHGLADEPGLPANSRVGEIYLARILEAVRVHRMLPDSRILVSVAGYTSQEAKRDFLDGMAEIFGLDRDEFILLSGARDTADELDLVLEEVRGTDLVVVSSASHLPRAVKMFADRGLEVVPAPCAYGVLESAEGPWSPVVLFPNARNLEVSENAIYELMGNVWVWGRGQRTEDGRRRTEDRGRRAEDGGPRTEDGGRRTGCWVLGAGD